MAVIYALTDPNTSQIRYVGKTTQAAEKRYATHLSNARRGVAKHVRLYEWMRSLASPPGLLILEDSPSDLNASERLWIRYLRRSGLPLCNVLDGGEGGTLAVQPEEWNRRRSETMKRRGQNEEQKAGLLRARVRALDPEVRRRAGVAISRAAKGRTPWNRRVWTPTLRERALEVYSRCSTREASRELGIGQHQLIAFLRSEGVLRDRHGRVQGT